MQINLQFSEHEYLRTDILHKVSILCNTMPLLYKFRLQSRPLVPKETIKKAVLPDDKSDQEEPPLTIHALSVAASRPSLPPL